MLAATGLTFLCRAEVLLLQGLNLSLLRLKLTSLGNRFAQGRKEPACPDAVLFTQLQQRPDRLRQIIADPQDSESVGMHELK